MPSRATWFGASQPETFGWIHTPDGPARGGVVLCPPLGREATAAHPVYRRLAEDLTAAGFVAVRFDFSGTGDSIDSAPPADCVDAWLTNIADAAALVRQYGAESVALVGLRMGGLLAEHAAALIPEIDALVLWDPARSGRVFVRRARALESLREAVGQSLEHPGIPGLEMPDAALATLSQLRSPSEPPQLPTLLLHPADEAPDTSPDGHMTLVTAIAIDAHEHREFLAVNVLESKAPTDTMATIVDWLTARLGESSSGPGKAGPQLVTADSVTVVASPEDSVITERVVALGSTGLVGVETVPASVNQDLPVIVILNTGNEWHAAPARVWVKMSREFARVGFRCVRMDLSGLGDSPTRPGQKPGRIYATEAFDDVDEAVSAVSPADPSNVVLMGLCSGGNQAIESGFTVRPRAVLVVNPATSVTETRISGSQRHIAIRKSRFTAAIARRIRSPRFHRVVSPIFRTLRRLRNRRNLPSQWLATFVDSGLSLYAICGTYEASVLVGGTERVLPRLTASGRLRIDVIDELEHTLMRIQDQDLVIGRFRDYLSSRFLGSPPAQPAPLLPAGRVGRSNAPKP